MALAAAAPSYADDYPQWRGSGRDGVSKETGLLKQWPKGGPKLLWRIDQLGTGYSTPSVATGKIFLISAKGDKEFAQALAEKDGQLLWSVEIGAVGVNKGPQYPGSRATPTVDGGMVYCLASDGTVSCLDSATGKLHWQRHYVKEFGGKAGMWAFSESLLVDGDVVVGTPGGATATLVALNKKSGATVWQSAVPGGDAAGYASIIVAPTGKVRQYVQFLHDGVVGVEAATGKFLWRDDRTKDVAANIPTPIFFEDHVFSGGSRTLGALAKLSLDGDGVKMTPAWSEVKLAAGIGGGVRVGPHLYVSASRGLTCADFITGKILWNDKSVGAASLCYADGHLYLHAHRDGTMALVEVNPASYREKGRFVPTDASENRAWTYPVVANGRLYVRDQEVLQCFDVRSQ